MFEMFKGLFYLYKARKAQMMMSAGPALGGFVIGLIIGFVVAILMYKGVIPGPFHC